MNNKYKIGEIVKDTDAFGDVQVKDILQSPTTSQWCYCVMVLDGSESHMLCWESELNKGAWDIK